MEVYVDIDVSTDRNKLVVNYPLIQLGVEQPLVFETPLFADSSQKLSIV